MNGAERPTSRNKAPDLADALDASALGRRTAYPSTYTPSLLHSIPRDHTRSSLGLAGATPFFGEDLWRCYEFSWLRANGLPAIACVEIRVPAASGAIVESKSLKLYLGSFAQTPFDDMGDVQRTLEGDLQLAFRSPVMVRLLEPEAMAAAPTVLPGTRLDDAAVGTSTYTVEAGLLGYTRQSSFVNKSWYTQLFRSLCPVTGQPDWATLIIDYAGEEFEPAALLRYLVSYREHAAFHEATIEQIFMDLLNAWEPRNLAVNGRFLRRGGIEINPYRATGTETAPDLRMPRQ